MMSFSFIPHVSRLRYLGSCRIFRTHCKTSDQGSGLRVLCLHVASMLSRVEGVGFKGGPKLLKMRGLRARGEFVGA